MSTVVRYLLLLFCSTTILISCQKEVNFDTPPGGNPGGGNPGTGTDSSIVGEYDFLGITASTYAAVTITSPVGEVQVVATSNYVSTNNKGTVSITSNNFVYNAVGYDIHAPVNIKTYIDSSLISDQDSTYDLITPPTNNTYPYTRISADSLTITGNLGVPDPTGVTPTGPVGVKTSWSGDTLILRVKTKFTQNVAQGGIPGILNGTVDGITKLKKRV